MKELGESFDKKVYPGNVELSAMFQNLETVRFFIGKTFKPEVNIKIDLDADKILRDNGVSGILFSLILFARAK